MKTLQRTSACGALACALLAACHRDLPLDSARRAAPPDAVLRTENPACAPAGDLHPQGVIIGDVTWSRAAGPHRVTGPVTVYGAGRLTIEPGTHVCFGSLGELRTQAGGRVRARGLDTARIVLTAADPAEGWPGMTFTGSSDSASVLVNVTVEHVTAAGAAVVAADTHVVALDSAVIRQAGQAVRLETRHSSLARSRVDTTTNAQVPAVVLGDSTRFEQTVVRGAAGVGVEVAAARGVRLMGGRIEGSGGVGLRVPAGAAIADADPVRVTGGAAYPAEMAANAFAKVYPALTDQDSLLGNARDTLFVTGGVLKNLAYARAVLPWRVQDTIYVEGWGILRAQPAARLFFAASAGVHARQGGRVSARGIKGYPVILGAQNPFQGWGGILLEGAPANPSYLTNVRVQHTGSYAWGVIARESHPVVIDSAVFRQNAFGASVWTAGSRISRTRVDTTTMGPALQLGGAVTLESTLVRGAQAHGVQIWPGGVQVLSCEVRGSLDAGIVVMLGGVTAVVRNCNMVDNGGPGIESQDLSFADAEDNWWGDAAGPTGPAGDGVSGDVDYTPWRTTPYVLPYVP